MGPHIDIKSDSLKAFVSSTSNLSLKPHFKSLFSKSQETKNIKKKIIKIDDIEDYKVINAFEDSIIALTGATLDENPMESFLDGVSLNIDSYDTDTTTSNMSCLTNFMSLDMDSFLKSALKMEKESYHNNKA